MANAFTFNSSPPSSSYAKSYGIDPSGNNVLGDVFRNASIGMAPSLYGSINFGNSVEPAREANLSNALNNSLSTQGIQNNNNAVRSQMLSGGSDFASVLKNILGGQGQGIGAVQGAQVNALNNANQSANNMVTQQASPQGQAEHQQFIQQLFQAAQTPQGLNALLAMFAPLEQRANTNYQQQHSGGLGGMLGSLGGILSMIPGLGGSQQGSGSNGLGALFGGL
jgi:hypothetical protein